MTALLGGSEQRPKLGFNFRAFILNRSLAQQVGSGVGDEIEKRLYPVRRFHSRF